MVGRHITLVALAAAVLAGCAPRVDIGASAGLRPGPETPYPFCRWDGSEASLAFCPPTAGAHGMMSWHVEDGTSSLCLDPADCNACVCLARCNPTDAGPTFIPVRPDAHGRRVEPAGPCPTPDSGTAVPECLLGDTCFLTCDHGETCPIGMRCVDNLEVERFVCAWVTW